MQTADCAALQTVQSARRRLEQLRSQKLLTGCDAMRTIPKTNAASAIGAATGS
jgi:hypothetical protein